MPARRVRIVAAFILVLAAILVWSVRSYGAPRVGAPEDPGAFGFSPGELVADFRFRAVGGAKGSLSDLLSEHVAVVVVMRTVDCPVSKKYGHEIARLEKEYGERGIAFVYLNVSPQDDEPAILEEIQTFGFAGPYIRDPEYRVGGALQPKVTTEVFVIDAAGTMRYRGAIDDQYGISFAKPAPRERWLRDALDAVLAGGTVETPTSEASGCFLEMPKLPVAPVRDITYHNRISRIVRDNCAMCHHDGGVAPMSLESFENVYGFRAMIRYVVAERRMPPWFADPAHGTWKNDLTLSGRDRRDLIAWIDAGAPDGRAAAPVPHTWVEDWQLPGPPDAVVAIPQPEQIPAEGVVDYRYVHIQTHFAEDRWIRAIEARPTARQVTHHIIAYLVDGPEDREGVWLGATAPGMPPNVYPDGTGKRLPKDAWIMFELHYTPNGTATTDQSMIGLVFTDTRPEREVRTAWVADSEFEIPPGAPHHEVVAERVFRRGGTLLSLMPHMHVRGKAFRYELVRADGSIEIVLDVPRYDFNWQLQYEFARPFRVEAGDILRGRAWYDNSAGNPANPDPTKTVRYGEQTFDEMMFGFYDWIADTDESAEDTENELLL